MNNTNTTTVRKIAEPDFTSNGDLVKTSGNGCQFQIVVFHTTTCPFCVQFMPTFQKWVKNKTTKFCFYSFNIQQNNVSKEFADRQWAYDTSSVPRIVAFRNGLFEKVYSGDRSINSLNNFLQSLSVNPSLVEHKTQRGTYAHRRKHNHRKFKYTFDALFQKSNHSTKQGFITELKRDIQEKRIKQVKTKGITTKYVGHEYIA